MTQGTMYLEKFKLSSFEECLKEQQKFIEKIKETGMVVASAHIESHIETYYRDAKGKLVNLKKPRRIYGITVKGAMPV